ncbi:MAG TPA: O-antigen ligase family protein [Ilumatobacteraceae bacterium]|nr:O-antigen ligase family protein [Ilumatobacteraceae bacterium]
MHRRPVGAIVSQMIVAGTSLLIALVVLRELGVAGLGTFSLLFAVLITVNSVQTGWIGDSLTVLDRFDPGIRRALFQSQTISAAAIFAISWGLALLIDGVDATTAVLFAVASVAWALEETLRRILIARREFWLLVANDGAFAFGAFGLLGAVLVSGAALTLDTVIISLLAGSIVAIGLGVVQLPRVELLRGPNSASRMRELASFASWRSVQVGLRPASQALVRAIVATTVGLEAVGLLEAARLLIAPALTVVNGAGIFFLPTYSDQIRRRVRLNPSVGRAMLLIAAICASYGLVAIALRSRLAELLTGGESVVTTLSVASWVLFSIAFGLGLPVGAANVAAGQSRQTFMIRLVDAGLGISIAGLCAVLGWVDAVPIGLAVGAFVGAGLLAVAVHTNTARLDTLDPDESMALPSDVLASAVGATPTESVGDSSHWKWSPEPIKSPEPTMTTPRPPAPPRRPSSLLRSATNETAPPRRHTGRADWSRELLWITPLVVIVAIEYKFRRRSIDGVLSGSIDLMIALELATLALVGTWSLWRLVPSKPRIEPLMMLMWGYILTTAASALYSEFPMLALARAVELVIIGAVVQLVSSQGTVTTINRLLHGWVALISASIVVGLVYVAPTTAPQEGRFTWLSVHSVSAGSMLAVSVPVVFGLWLAAGRRPMPWPRWVYAGMVIAQVAFLLLTRTRGSIGGTLVALAVMAWLSSGRKARPELVLGSLIAGGAFALAFGRQILEFLTRGETVDQIGTFNRRTEIWSLAWESFLERPLFGLGFNSAKGVFFDETGLGGAHNSVINVMIDVGLAGLIWWTLLVVSALVLLGRLLRRERRSPVLLVGATGTARSDELILVGIFVALLINSITTEGLGAGVSVMAIWFFLSCAWLTILDADQRTATHRATQQRRLEPAASS